MREAAHDVEEATSYVSMENGRQLHDDILLELEGDRPLEVVNIL
jgi:hypothetical protein